MPRLRRLNAREVIQILEGLGFVQVRVKGSHYRFMFRAGDKVCFTTVPVHGSNPIATTTLRSIYRQAASCIPEDELTSLFYTE